MGVVYVKASRRSKAYLRKSALGKVNRARLAKKKLADANWAANGNIARESTLHKRYSVVDRYEANARNARLTRRAIGFRTRRARGYR